MRFKFKTFPVFTAIAAFFCFCAPAFAYTYGEPCGAALNGLSKSSGAPGDTFEMRGRWGDKQELHRPSINKGGQNGLEVVSWTPSVLTVRVPQNLGAGKYRVGVYCNDPGAGSKGTYSSGWMDFDVTAPTASAQTPQADNRRGDNPRPLIENAGSDSAAAPAAPVAQSPAPQKQHPVKDTPKTSAIEKMLDGILNMDLDIGDFTLQVIIAIVVIVIVFGVILYLKQVVSFDVKADFKFSQKTQSQANPLPKTGADLPQGTDIPAPFSGAFKGTEYVVESLDSETMTVHIGIPKLLPKRFDFFTDKMPRFENAELESEVSALIRLGAVYIDISGNTNWVAALFPFDVRVDKRLAEDIAAHLIKLRDLCSK